MQHRTDESIIRELESLLDQDDRPGAMEEELSERIDQLLNEAE